MTHAAAAQRLEQRIFLVGDDPALVAAILRQDGLRLAGQVPNMTLLLPLIRDCPADTLLLTAAAFEDWPPAQALPRVRAINPALRLALVLDAATELETDQDSPQAAAGGRSSGPDWRFPPHMTPAQVARALLAGAPAGLVAGGRPAGFAEDGPPKRLLRLFVRAGRSTAATPVATPAAAQPDAVLDLPPSPTVLAVFGPKGGSGKTTVAVNLAAALAVLHPGRVLLVDLNLRSADVGLHLDLLDGPTLVDALPFAAAADAAALLPYVQEHRGTGLRVLLGPPRADLGELVKSEAMVGLIRTLQQRFPLVVLDLAAGSGEDVLQYLKQADRVLLVTTLDPAALRQTKLGLEAVRAGCEAVLERTLLVANRVRTGGALSRGQAEDFLGIHAAGELPEDVLGVGQALAVGEPAVLRRPDTDLAWQVEDVLRQIGLAVRPRPRTAVSWLNRFAWR